MILFIHFSLQYFYEPKEKTFEDASIEEINHSKLEVFIFNKG